MGEAEQDQKVEEWLESLEDIFRTLQYLKEVMVKFATFPLRDPARGWWIRVQEIWEQSGKE
jgi:hypothetical protein